MSNQNQNQNQNQKSSPNPANTQRATSIRLSAYLTDAIKELAQQENLTPSQAHREALEEGLAHLLTPTSTSYFHNQNSPTNPTQTSTPTTLKAKREQRQKRQKRQALQLANNPAHQTDQNPDQASTIPNLYDPDFDPHTLTPAQLVALSFAEQNYLIQKDWAFDLKINSAIKAAAYALDAAPNTPIPAAPTDDTSPTESESLESQFAKALDEPPPTTPTNFDALQARINRLKTKPQSQP